jgi:hypothetical protein
MHEHSRMPDFQLIYVWSEPQSIEANQTAAKRATGLTLEQRVRPAEGAVVGFFCARPCAIANIDIEVPCQSGIRGKVFCELFTPFTFHSRSFIASFAGSKWSTKSTFNLFKFAEWSVRSANDRSVRHVSSDRLSWSYESCVWLKLGEALQAGGL